MTNEYKERYDKAKTWDERAIIIDLYHTLMRHRDVLHNLKKTAKYFDLSIGKVSEDIKLAEAINKDDSILSAKSRTLALGRINHKE